MELKFVKFACGCIGTLPKPGERMFILNICDGDGHEPLSPDNLDYANGRVQSLLTKTWEPLTHDELFKYLDTICDYFWKGARLVQIKQALQ